jgi:hypothetical protein
MTTPTEFQFTDYQPYDFANRRHIGPSPSEMTDMLKVVGYSSLDKLIDATVPPSIRQKAPLAWGPAMTEREALDKLRETANKNKVLVSLIGQGYYGTITPPVIQRNILENPAWYTAYTPYQPEISQGRLEALLNYQTMICDLTGLDVANASLLDEATAAAEGMAMAERVSKSKAKAFFVDAACHPQTIELIKTRAEPLGWSVVIGNPFTDLDPVDVFGAIFQYPGTHGHVHDFTGLISRLHQTGAIAIVAADILALTLLKSPGRNGRRYRHRQFAALRRSGRLRRPACGLHVGQGRPQALHAGPSRRRLGRRPRQPRLPPVAADPRTAHPPRKGDVEHLHRAGAARRHGLDVRRLPRPQGHQGDRPAGSPEGRADGQGPGKARLHHRAGNLLRHHHRRCRPHAGRHPACGRRRGRQPAQGRRHEDRHERSTSAPARRRWKPSGAPSAAISRWPSSSRAIACRRGLPAPAST